MKTFHVTGTCVPEKNYMVDITAKLDQIIRMIEKGDYFTINRARQYGKTTTFSMLYRRLKDRYLVLRLTFEGLGDSSFSSERAFVETFINSVTEFGEWVGLSVDMMQEWSDLSLLQKDAQKDPFEYLCKKITGLCRACGQGVILMIDEVDKSSDNQIFLNFLGMLRNKYLKSREGLDITFQSVILAGVYDIKNLKLKMRSEEEKKYNSPWNVAADFKVDMSFSPTEIQTMLEEYEEDYHTGMDMEAISRELYFYTGGYPFLVSRLCKWVDEEGHKIWTTENIKKAENELLHTPCTLFDDLIKNYENNPELQKMIDSILAEGAEYAFVMTDPVISQGVMFGIFKRRKNSVVISNIIFETLLYNHVMSKKSREKQIFTGERSQFLESGELNMPQILNEIPGTYEIRISEIKHLED